MGEGEGKIGRGKFTTEARRAQREREGPKADAFASDRNVACTGEVEEKGKFGRRWALMGADREGGVENREGKVYHRGTEGIEGERGTKS